MCALSWVLTAAELIILKWLLSIQPTVKSVSIPAPSLSIWVYVHFPISFLILAVHNLCNSSYAFSPLISYFEIGESSIKPTFSIVFLHSYSTDGYQFW